MAWENDLEFRALREYGYGCARGRAHAGSGSLGPNHFETVAGSAIPVRAGHAANGEQLAEVHPPSLGINQTFPRVQAFDQADDDPVFADMKSGVLDALQAHRTFGDAGRPYYRGRQ